MVGHSVIISDSKEDAHIQCPQCKSKPSAALLKHSEAAALPLQQRHVKKFHAAETQSAIDQLQHAQPPTDQSELPCELSCATLSWSAGPSVPVSPSPSLHASDTPEKWDFSEIDSENEDEHDEHEDAQSNPKPKGEHFLLKR